MEYRPNSRPERTGPYVTVLIMDSSTNTRSADIGPDEDRGHSPIQPLTEHCINKRAINQWTLPKHPPYNLINARLDSLKNWPKGHHQYNHCARPVSFTEVRTFFTKF